MTPDGVVFIVGSAGTVLVGRGGTWAEATEGVYPWLSLSGVWASAADDVFALSRGGMILHFDGVSWSEMDFGTDYTLIDIWGSASDEVYAVGDEGTIVHFDGRAWSRRSIGDRYDLVALVGSSPTDITVLGEFEGILHWDGTSWTTEHWSGANLHSLTSTSDGRIFVAAGSNLYQRCGE